MVKVLHYICNNFLTGADCVPIGSSGLTHLVVSDNAELDNIPVTPSRVKVVKQQVCVCVCVCVCTCVYVCVCTYVTIQLICFHNQYCV